MTVATDVQAGDTIVLDGSPTYLVLEIGGGLEDTVPMLVQVLETGTTAYRYYGASEDVEIISATEGS